MSSLKIANKVPVAVLQRDGRPHQAAKISSLQPPSVRSHSSSLTASGSRGTAAKQTKPNMPVPKTGLKSANQKSKPEVSSKNSKNELATDLLIKSTGTESSGFFSDQEERAAGLDSKTIKRTARRAVPQPAASLARSGPQQHQRPQPTLSSHAAAVPTTTTTLNRTNIRTVKKSTVREAHTVGKFYFPFLIYFSLSLSLACPLSFYYLSQQYRLPSMKRFQQTTSVSGSLLPTFA